MVGNRPRLKDRFRRSVSRFKAGPVHLAGPSPSARGSRLVTVLVLRWLRAFMVAHFTATGAVLFLLSFMFAAFVMEAGRWRPGHLPPLAILVLFGVNAIMGWICLPRLRVTRSVPGSVMAGDRLPVEYDLRNLGRLPLWDAEIEALPLPAGMRFAAPRPTLSALGAGDKARLRAEIVPTRRGRYLLGVPRVDSAFPFLLWRWGRNGSGPRKVVVYPSFTPLADLDMSFGVRYQPGGVALSSNVGASMEFLSCREFRHGDDPRHLHPRSWARLGVPVVREFREEYLCRTALVLDTYRPRPRYLPERHQGDPVLESAISLAAALADYLARSEYLVEFFAAGPDIYRFEAGRSLAYFEDILDVLSCLEAARADPFPQLANTIENEKLQMSSAILVLLNWDDTRAELVRDLTNAGVAVKVLLVDGQRKADRARVPEHVQRLEWKQIRDGECVAL